MVIGNKLGFILSKYSVLRIFKRNNLDIMRWQGRETSKNVQDLRGRSTGGGGGIRMPRMPRGRGGRAAGAGAGIVALIVAVVMVLSGEDPSVAMDQLNQQGGGGLAPREQTTGPKSTNNAKEDEAAEFVSVVLKDCEDVWHKVFREQLGKNYQEPILVLYNDEVNSACGFSSAATGPFYCPGDQKLYIDLSFYDELRTRFKAPGDFAMAYVVAHEVGHHVQYLLGDSRRVSAQRNRVSKAEYNRLSVMLELQADFYAGLWAHHAQEMKDILESGDVDEALRAANAIGDDRLQKQARGYAVPETFTHGTSAQRMRWFKKGMESGKMKDGDTFNAVNL